VTSHYANDPHYFHWHGKPVIFFTSPITGNGRTLSTWALIRSQVDPHNQMIWSAEGVDTHHSRNREKEKRIILAENGKMNTTMTHFAWFHSHLRNFTSFDKMRFSQVGKATIKNGYFLHQVGPIIRFSQILLREW